MVRLYIVSINIIYIIKDRYEYRMPTYEEAAEDRFTDASTVSIAGIALDFEGERRIASKSCTPIANCVMDVRDGEIVWDCSSSFVWISQDDILDRSRTGQRSTEGEEIEEFRLRPDAGVIVESTTLLTAGRVSQLAKLVEDMGGDAEDLDYLFQEAPKLPNVRIPGPAGSLWNAFRLGYEIGKAADKEFDLSDKLSDLLVDIFD